MRKDTKPRSERHTDSPLDWLKLGVSFLLTLAIGVTILKAFGLNEIPTSVSPQLRLVLNAASIVATLVVVYFALRMPRWFRV